ncbi:MAG: hypothetical protein ACFCU1_11575 [Sumerlaeia bacterium]
MEILLSIIIGLAVFLIIIAVAGFIFGLAVRIVCKFQPSLGTCMLYVVLIGIIQAVLGGLIQVSFQSSGNQSQFSSILITFFTSVVLNSFLIGMIVKDESNEAIGFIKGLLVYLLNTLIGVVIGIVCVGIPLVAVGIFSIR